jgi:hypothetical protein
MYGRPEFESRLRIPGRPFTEQRATRKQKLASTNLLERFRDYISLTKFLAKEVQYSMCTKTCTISMFVTDGGWICTMQSLNGCFFLLLNRSIFSTVSITTTIRRFKKVIFYSFKYCAVNSFDVCL